MKPHHVKKKPHHIMITPHHTMTEPRHVMPTPQYIMMKPHNVMTKPQYITTQLKYNVTKLHHITMKHHHLQITDYIRKLWLSIRLLHRFISYVQAIATLITSILFAELCAGSMLIQINHRFTTSQILFHYWYIEGMSLKKLGPLKKK